MKTKGRVIVVAMAIILALLPVSAKAGWFLGLGQVDDCKCCGEKAGCDQSPKSKKPAVKSKPKPKKKIVATTAADDAKLKSLVDRAEKAAERSEAGAERSEKAASRSEVSAKESAVSAVKSQVAAANAEETAKKVELFSKEVIDRIAKSAKDGRIPKTETKTEAKAEVKVATAADPPKKEVKKTTDANAKKVNAKTEEKDEQKCVTMGSVSMFTGTGLMFVPGGQIPGAILLLSGIFDKEVYGSNTDPRCKAAAAVLGGAVGYGVREATSSDHHSSSGDSGPGEPPPVPGPGTGEGPTTPPPVP